MSVTYSRFPTPRAVRPKNAPVMLVSDKAEIGCGCAVYVGTVAGKGQASVFAHPCPTHEEEITVFYGYLGQAIASAGGAIPQERLTTLAGELLEATFPPGPTVGSPA